MAPRSFYLYPDMPPEEIKLLVDQNPMLKDLSEDFNVGDRVHAVFSI